MDIEEVLMGIDEYVKPIRDFLEASTPAKIKAYFQVQFGSGEPPEYYFRLCKLVKAKYADFRPDGMTDWEAEQSEDRNLDSWYSVFGVKVGDKLYLPPDQRAPIW
jgi:hypothetical protein